MKLLTLPKCAFAFSGALLLLLPQAAIAAPGEADGATVFRQRCQACHSVVIGKPPAIGPNLSGVVGRKAASTAFNYSTALKRSWLTCDRRNLDVYLTAPNRLVPGTRMTVTLSDVKQRTALIAYLSKAK